MKNLLKSSLTYIILRLFKRQVIALMQRNGFFVDNSMTVKQLHRFFFKEYKANEVSHMRY